MATQATGHFWFDDSPQVVELLEAVRCLCRADSAMRRRLSASMAMNVTDLQAVRLVIAAEMRAQTISPRHLARDLGISTASTTKLLDRLEGSGHLVRVPHPTDRRAAVIASTRQARDEIREQLERMHDEMVQIARSVPVPVRPHLVGFLERMAHQLEREGDAVEENTGAG